MERFKCDCGNNEFIPWPITAQHYTEAEIMCTKCEKVWGLPKVIADEYRYEDDKAGDST